MTEPKSEINSKQICIAADTAVAKALSESIARWDLGYMVVIPDRSDMLSTLRAIESSQLLVVDFITAPKTGAWMIGYAIARGKTALGFGCAADKLSEESSYCVNDMDALRSVLEGIAPRRSAVDA